MSTRLQKLWVSVENEDSPTYSASDVVDVSDVIENEETIEEADELNDEIGNITEGLDVYSGEEEELSEIVEHNEEILNNPEEKSEEEVEKAVEVSQEALHDTYVILIGKKYRDSNRLSLEHLETNIEKLRYSTESLKDFIINIWEKIKELYIRFVYFLKKYSIKFFSLFTSRKVSIGKLMDRLKNIKSFTKEDAEKIVKNKRKYIENTLFLFKIIIKKNISSRDFIKSVFDGLSKLVDDASKSIDSVQKFKETFIGELVSGVFTKQAKINKNHAGDENRLGNFIAKNLSAAFGIDKEAKRLFDLDDGEEVLAVYPQKFYSLTALTTKGNLYTEDVEDDKIFKKSDSELAEFIFNNSNIDMLKDNFGHLSRGMGGLEKSSRSFINAVFKEADKNIKLAIKIKDDLLKGSSDFETSSEIRKELNTSLKIETKLSFLMLNFIKFSVSLISGYVNALAVYSRYKA